MIICDYSKYVNIQLMLVVIMRDYLKYIDIISMYLKKYSC